MKRMEIMFPVIYNGGTDTLGLCDNPSNLKKGNVYWVKDVKELSSHTEYILEGIDSYAGFNMRWFDDVPIYEVQPFYSWQSFPKVGDKLKKYYRRPFESNEQWQFIETSTPIEAVHMIAKGKFIVYTARAAYMLTFIYWYSVLT